MQEQKIDVFINFSLKLPLISNVLISKFCFCRNPLICDPDTYIWYCFFGEPGSLNDLNVLEKSTIVGSILNGMMELCLPEELHYSINGTVHDYLYFLVDGIYPKWPIFISTVSNATPGSKDKLFATHQEAVRKDIE